jgi:hypothetical protein
MAKNKITNKNKICKKENLRYFTVFSNSFCSSIERTSSNDCWFAPTFGEALAGGVDVADVWIWYLTSSSFDWIKANSFNNDYKTKNDFYIEIKLNTMFILDN